MKSLSKLLLLATGTWLALSACARPVAGAASPKLQTLAARAAARQGWPALRRYAASQAKGEERGLAYFALGYREYQAREYAAAIEDFALARATRFSLGDFAEYFGAASANKAGEPGPVVEVLDGFFSRHSESLWRVEALTLFARASLGLNDAERVIRALTAETRLRQRADLVLLLAYAYWQAQRFREAAQTFQEVYYKHPTTTEAARAADALVQLEPVLGSSFPAVSEEIQTSRVDALFASARFADALKGYNALLQTHSTSALAGRWKLGRARCLLRLKRTTEALDGLREAVSSDPALDAERLDEVVEAYAQLQDVTAMLRALEQLAALYAHSPSYASALFSVGNFFARQNDWESALRYYKAMADNFPQDGRSLGAHWRVAWGYYLQGQKSEARQAFVEHIKRYPNSPRLPAALYWLGRLEEQAGGTSEARTIYSLLDKRFPHSYYVSLVDARLRALGMERAQLDAGSPLGDLAQAIPPAEPLPLSICDPPAQDEILRVVGTLRSLDLAEVAEPYLRSAVADRSAAPHLVLELSRVEAEEGKSAAALVDAKRLVPNPFEYEFSHLPREMWDLLYPRAFWKLVQQQARANRLDPYLVMGLIRQESAFNPLAISRANARGLMQVLPGTASSTRRGRAIAAHKLYDPAYNIRVGSRILRQLLDTFHGDLEQTLAAYNAGDFRVDDWLSKRAWRDPQEFLESIPFRETRAYVEAVLRDAAIYRQLITGSPKFKKCS